MNLSSTLEGNNICLLWFFTIQTSLKISLEDCQCLCFQDTQYETPYFTSIRIMIIKKERKKTSIGDDVEKLEHLCIAGGNLKGAAPVESNMVVPQKS